ncbi:MAG: HDOD domain-containing protein [Pseudomonadota bacterium]
MSSLIPSKIKNYLEQENIDYQVFEHEGGESIYQIAQSHGIPDNEVARAILLEENGLKVLAIIPASHMLDFKTLCDNFKSSFSPIPLDSEKVNVFSGCEPGCRPPFPALFGLSGVVDIDEFNSDYIYLEPGTTQCLIRVSKSDFVHIQRESEVTKMTCSPQTLVKLQSENLEVALSSFTPKRIKQRLDETFDLPAMPAIAREIMKLRVDPSAEAKDLADIVTKDPSLAAQVISWASSPYYGYQGQVSSVEIAISRVLGFDLVMNLALGIAIGKSLKIPDDGPLGLRNFWRQAVYSATLSERLCTLIPPKVRPQRGLVYLSGLLHNFGHLLLGHVFPPQFFTVNRYIEANCRFPIEQIEHFVLGVTHEEMGAWLMQSWNMPDELITAVRYHHQDEYSGIYREYANLVTIANCMLKRLAIGDSSTIDPSVQLLTELGIKKQDVENVFDNLMDRAEELDMLSKQLVA